ncbi:unnamed protein product [Adineta steineri]|uniref:Uncharacterized protein n=1 Tax=Adineta steineri TaxID=433720 RepID=A0A818UET4_9BILA|nr:unnamed protein product [Adineta steineri]
MAPLTLTEKYDDLVRCADQPLSSYDKLNSEDLEDVINKIWPFLIESITYTPLSLEKNESVSASTQFNGDIRTKLARRLKIQFHLYSEAANRCQQKFPNRKPSNRNKTHINAYLRDSGSLSFETSSIFSLDNISKINIPDFYVFCVPKYTNRKQQQIDYDRVSKYILTTIQTSPYRMLIFKQALKECGRCGNYYQLGSLCLAADTAIEKIHFDNNDTILHECIKLNNKQLARELIKYKFNIDVDGELGTPLVTAVHYNILWADCTIMFIADTLSLVQQVITRYILSTISAFGNLVYFLAISVFGLIITNWAISPLVYALDHTDLVSSPLTLCRIRVVACAHRCGVYEFYGQIYSIYSLICFRLIPTCLMIIFVNLLTIKLQQTRSCIQLIHNNFHIKRDEFCLGKVILAEVIISRFCTFIHPLMTLFKL